MQGRNNRAVIDALLPSGADTALPLGAFETGYEAFVRELDQTAVLPLRLTFRLALFLCAWLAPILIRRFPPTRRLEPEARVAALDALSKSRFYLMRQLILLLKMNVCLCYGADERVRQAIGYGQEVSDVASAEEGGA